MIRRLVEQQHVRTAEQDLRQLDAHVPALRESLGPAPELGFFETQARERALHRFFRRLALCEHQCVIHFVEFDDQLVVSG